MKAGGSCPASQDNVICYKDTGVDTALRDPSYRHVPYLYSRSAGEYVRYGTNLDLGPSDKMGGNGYNPKAVIILLLATASVLPHVKCVDVEEILDENCPYW